MIRYFHSADNQWARFTESVYVKTVAYEKVLRKAKDAALQEMADQAKELGANAVLSIDLDYETIGGSMLMVTASGTAVTVA